MAFLCCCNVLCNVGHSPDTNILWPLLTFSSFQVSSYPSGQMGLWLKDETKKHGTYTVAQYNTIPTGVQGIAIVSAILATSLCMIYPLWSIMTIVCSILLFSNVVLLVYHVPKNLHCKYIPLTSVYIWLTIHFSRGILLPWFDVSCNPDSISMGQRYYER
jgi:hypothetical protein